MGRRRISRTHDKSVGRLLALQDLRMAERAGEVRIVSFVSSTQSGVVCLEGKKGSLCVRIYFIAREQKWRTRRSHRSGNVLLFLHAGTRSGGCVVSHAYDFLSSLLYVRPRAPRFMFPLPHSLTLSHTLCLTLCLILSHRLSLSLSSASLSRVKGWWKTRYAQESTDSH